MHNLSTTAGVSNRHMSPLSCRTHARRKSGCRPPEHVSDVRVRGFLFSPERDAVARRAGQRSPSETTWAVVLGKLTPTTGAALAVAA